MKKKDLLFLWSLLAILMVTTLSVGLSSCGSNDDDDEGGGSSSSGISISLVGKTFSKSETNYTEIGEKEVNKETISFITETKCTLRCWGSWENIYSDGSKDTNKYDTGDMNGTYSISGNMVSIRIPGNEGYDRDITIVDGKLLGYK